MRETVIRYIAILAYAALALWLIFFVGGWWIWLGGFLLLGLLHPATWRQTR